MKLKAVEHNQKTKANGPVMQAQVGGQSVSSNASLLAEFSLMLDQIAAVLADGVSEQGQSKDKAPSKEKELPESREVVAAPQAANRSAESQAAAAEQKPCSNKAKDSSVEAQAQKQDDRDNDQSELVSKPETDSRQSVASETKAAAAQGPDSGKQADASTQEQIEGEVSANSENKEEVEVPADFEVAPETEVLAANVKAEKSDQEESTEAVSDAEVAPVEVQEAVAAEPKVLAAETEAVESTETAPAEVGADVIPVEKTVATDKPVQVQAQVADEAKVSETQDSQGLGIGLDLGPDLKEIISAHHADGSTGPSMSADVLQKIFASLLLRENASELSTRVMLEAPLHSAMSGAVSGRGVADMPTQSQAGAQSVQAVGAASSATGLANRMNEQAPSARAYVLDRPLSRPAAARTMEKVEQALRDAAKSKDGKTISVRLDPPSLGTMRVDVSLRDGALHARVVAESSQVNQMLRERMHEMQSMLRKLGLNVDTVSVSVGSGNEQFEEKQASDQRIKSQNGRHGGLDFGADELEGSPVNQAETQQNNGWVA